MQRTQLPSAPLRTRLQSHLCRAVWVAFSVCMVPLPYAQASDFTKDVTQGVGETNIADALANAQLNQLGITHPTRQQMDAALKGATVQDSSGKTVALQGVLVQRRSGLGWGEIAHSLGLNLGQVISAWKSNKSGKKAPANPAGTPRKTSPTSKEGTSHASTKSHQEKDHGDDGKGHESHGGSSHSGGGNSGGSHGGGGGKP